MYIPAHHRTPSIYLADSRPKNFSETQKDLLLEQVHFSTFIKVLVSFPRVSISFRLFENVYFGLTEKSDSEKSKHLKQTY